MCVMATPFFLYHLAQEYHLVTELRSDDDHLQLCCLKASGLKF